MMNDEEERALHINQRIKACEDLLASTLVLKRNIEMDEMDAVIRSLERRSELIRLIDGLDNQVSQRSRASRRDGNRAAIEKSKVINESFKKRMQEILSVNNECQKILSEKCKVLKKDIADIQHQEEGVQGYSRQTVRTPKFVNFST